MRKLGYVLGTLIVFSCGSPDEGLAPTDGDDDDDGFAVGTQPLQLLPAPPGLCSGDGSQKECADPGGCQEEGSPSGDLSTSSGGTGAATGAQGTGGSSYYATGGSGGWTGYGGSVSDGDGATSAGGATAGEPAAAGAAGAVVSTGGTGNAAAGGGSGEGGAAGEAGSVGLAGSPGIAGEPAVPAAGAPAAAEADSPQTRTQALRPQADQCQGLDRSTPYTLYLSADDSNSTASPVIARSLIRRGATVSASIVRTYEFLNYYDFSFEPAPPGEVRIVSQLSSCPTDGELSFQVALQSEERSDDERAPLNVTFVLDTSGSMSGSPIQLERAAVLAVAEQLQAGDIVSMVTWDTLQRAIITGHEVSGPNDSVVVEAALALESGGGTNLQAGLVSGYTVAQQHYSADRINRVILISDGQANVGITDEELIGGYADDEEGEEGIYLSGIGVGDGVNDILMNAVTDAGRGAYVFLDSEEEAYKMLGDRFLQVVDLAARAVRLEVTLPYYMEIIKFYGEEMSTNPNEVRPQHLGPNDAMVFFQILQACDPALLHGDDRIRLRATWEMPFTRQLRSEVMDATLNELAGDDANLTKAAAIAGYAETLIMVDMVQDPELRLQLIGEALGNVHAAQDADTDPDLLEVAELLEQYAVQFGG